MKSIKFQKQLSLHVIAVFHVENDKLDATFFFVFHINFTQHVFIIIILS